MTDLARNTIQPFNYFHLLDTQKLDCKRKILSLEKDTAIENIRNNQTKFVFLFTYIMWPNYIFIFEYSILNYDLGQSKINFKTRKNKKNQ